MPSLGDELHDNGLLNFISRRAGEACLKRKVEEAPCRTRGSLCYGAGGAYQFFFPFATAYTLLTVIIY